MRVLNSMEDNTNKDEASSSSLAAKQTKSPMKRKRLDEEIKDLESEQDSLSSLKGAQLKLTHVDRYFIAPKLNDSAMQTQTAATLLAKSGNFKATIENTLKQVKDWNLSIQKLAANHSLAISILVELSPGSLLMQSNGEQNLKGDF